MNLAAIMVITMAQPFAPPEPPTLRVTYPVSVDPAANFQDTPNPQVPPLSMGLEDSYENRMKTNTQTDLAQHCRRIAQQAREASVVMARTPGADRIHWLRSVAQALRDCQDTLLRANQRDIEAAPAFGLTPAATDRLRLDAARIEAMAAGTSRPVAARAAAVSGQ